MISAITAVDADWGIGFENQLLERIPEDMQKFKEFVTDKFVIVGSKTWETLPKTRAFLDRNYYFVISRQYDEPFVCIPNTRIMYSHLDEIPRVYEIAEKNNKDVVIIGGGFVYKQLLPHCQEVLVTKIHTSHDNVDTYFPNLDLMDDWIVDDISEIRIYQDIPYQFQHYSRV